VIHGGLEQVKIGTGRGQFAPARSGRLAAEFRIVDGGTDDADAHAASDGFEQQVGRKVVGHEIRMGEFDGFSRGGDGEQISEARRRWKETGFSGGSDPGGVY
jgi:hypothetical protein